MQKKEISTFAATYIILGLLGILFLLYNIGIQIYTVQTQNAIFIEKIKENARLEYEYHELKKVREIRSTRQYIDRFQKENFNIYQDGEVVLVLPPQDTEKGEFDGLSPAEIEKELAKKQPIIEQWKSVFFGEKE